MFGGLELKGSNAAAAAAAAPTPSSASPASSSSAFSFLNAWTTSTSTMENPSVTTNTNSPAPAPSSFSFLNPTPPATTTTTTSSGLSHDSNNKNHQPATTTTNSSSGFGFIQASLSGPGETPASHSAFSFLQPAAPVPVPDPVPEADTEEAEPPTSLSAFSFLSNPTTTSTGSNSTLTLDDNNSPAETVTMSSTTTFMSATATTARPEPALEDLLATQHAVPPPAPAGSGVVFGGTSPSMTAATAPKKPIKRRTRTSKIGTAAATPPSLATATTPPIASSSSRPPLPTSSSSSSASSEQTREAAVEATRRAEQFLKEKMEAATVADPVTEAAGPATVSIDQDDPDDDVEDDIVAAAKAAAEEAQLMNQAPPSLPGPAGPMRTLSDRMGLGGLFRTSRSSPPTTLKPGVRPEASSSTNRSLHGIPSLSHHTPVPLVKTSSSTSLRNHHDDTTSDASLMPAASRGSKETAERRPSLTQPSSHLPPSSALRIADNKDVGGLASRETTSSHLLNAAAEQTRTGPSLSYESPKPAFSFMASSTVSPKPVVVAPIQPLTTATGAGGVQPRVKTPQDLFEDMLKEFRSQVVKATEEVGRLRQHRTALLEDQVVALAKQRLATQQKAQAETQQMAAAEAEDFELADQMGSLMETHDRTLMECQAVLENIDRALKQLEGQKQVVVERVMQCFRNVKSQLQKFQEEQDSQEMEDAAEALRKFSAYSKLLSAENERLQQDLKHLERDAALVADERKELELAIAEQAGEFERQRAKAQQSLTAVEHEIEQLRQQLAAKQTVAAQLRTEAAGHEESILKVRVKFSRQLTRVQKKEMNIEDNRREWEAEKRSYEFNREEHEAKVKAHSEALVAKEQLLQALKKESETAETFESVVAKEITFEVLSAEEGDADEELAQLKAEVVKSEAAVFEAKELLKAATRSIQKLEEEVRSLEDSIPHLEELKKAAATRRDFKAAGKASKEIKEATSRLKDIQEELMGEATERKAAAEDELRKLDTELAAMQAIVHEKEKEQGAAVMKRLADDMKRLLEIKKKLCGDDDESPLSIQGVGALVLDAQINALKSEGEALGEKYGGWEEHLTDLGVAKDKEADPNAAEIIAEPKAEVRPDGTTYLVQEEENHDAQLAALEEAAETDNNNTAKAADKDEVDDGDKLAQMLEFVELTQQLKDAEASVEAAAEQEDFELAEQLQEELQGLLNKIQALELTDDEMERALSHPNLLKDLGGAPAKISGEPDDHEQPETDTPANNEPLDQEASDALPSAVTSEEAAPTNEGEVDRLDDLGEVLHESTQEEEGPSSEGAAVPSDTVNAVHEMDEPEV